jgi:hypothetical protein
VLIALAACARGERDTAAAAVIHGPLAELMTQHATAGCGVSTRTYETIFWHPPYQACLSKTAELTEAAEIDSDSLVVELYNTWELTPANHASTFAQAEGDLKQRFGIPRQCNENTVEWRQGDSLHVVLQVKPASQVGTEFDEGPWRMTRLARLGPLDPAEWGC